MKAPPKLLIGSSPGRAESLPAPPFSRLVRGKGGSRSRGRRTRPRALSISTSRRSSELLEGKDPASPKVTCMGQVRIHRKTTKKKTTKKNKCPWSSLFRKLFSAVKWPAWLVGKDRRRLFEEEEEEEEEPKKKKQQQPFLLEEEAATAPPVAPPKNALLLMRCRSAPQRGSFLGSRLWEEPKEEEEGPKEEEERSRRVEGGTGLPSPPSSPRARARAPPLLTRCKSEPARSGERRKLLAMADEAFPRRLLLLR